MAAKSVVYFAGRGVINLPRKNVQKRLDDAHRRIEAWRWGTPAFLVFTATIGLPPYYLVSFLAGTLRYNFLLFLVTGLIGRGIRFGVVAFAPWMFESLLG
jgi:membrane protein YqaA with SNARE-associated domain